MKFTAALPALLAASVSAQSLTEALASQNATLSVLNGLIASQPGIASALGSASNITILAPSNEALQALLADAETTAAIAADPGLVAAILSYHVLQGTYKGADFAATPKFIPSLLTNGSYANVTGGQRVEARTIGSTVSFKSGLQQTANVTQADVTFNNGVIHIINSVLTLPPKPAEALTAFNLTSLATALTTAKLVDTVSGLKDVTIFAPANAAFEAIASQAANLTVEQITGVLTYHVVQGSVVYSTGVTDGAKAKTVNGQELSFSVKDGVVSVNNAKVIVPDVFLANGVVHVIDAVLLPNATGTGTGTGSPSPSASRPPTGASVMQVASVGMAALFAGAAFVFNL